MINLLDLITPTNLETEKIKFFASGTYNPLFHYIWQDSKLDPIFSIKLKYDLWNSIKTQQTNKIVDAAKKLFEIDINEDLLKHAKHVASTKGLVSTGSASEYSSLMREGLDYFGINDFKIVMSDEAGFNARPNHVQKTITISKHIHFEYFSMEGGVHHELVHILRYLNGKHNKIIRSQNFLPTEEGLASWCQDNANDDNGYAQHAIEYVASEIGLTGGLRDIYNCMLDYGMSPELAWKRSVRHKFGFVDTSKPGDILKPAMYFDNEEKISKLTTDQRLRLFVGKISLPEISDYPTYNGHFPEARIIEYFKL